MKGSCKSMACAWQLVAALIKLAVLPAISFVLHVNVHLPTAPNDWCCACPAGVCTFMSTLATAEPLCNHNIP
jgi:hypothetical protein